jgi:chromosome partitioning protein
MGPESPPAPITGREGVVEAPPAGEISGRVAFSGSRQDGETSTVDQSREWPFRDTAPRQDPAVSRPDPIWGDDVPHSVRWHMGMATGEGHPDQSEQPGPATEAGVADPAAGDAGWFSVDPDAEGEERPGAEQRGPAPTVSREADRDAPLDRPAAPSGPDLISAGMVHVDPEPGIDSPGGVGRPQPPPGHGPDPRPDRPGGYGATGEPPTAGEVREGSQRSHAAAIDAAAEVELGAGVREPDRDAEPVPWTEPALPVPWPTPVGGRAGGDSGGVPEDAESEQPPPDPRWPRLFAVGAEAAAARLEPGGDPEADRRLAEHEIPAADPAPSGGPPSTSAPPQQPPDQTGDADGAAVSAAGARTWPEAGEAGAATDAAALGTRPDGSPTDGVDEDAEAARRRPDGSAAASDALDAAAAGMRPGMPTGPGWDRDATGTAADAAATGTGANVSAGPRADGITPGTAVDAATAGTDADATAGPGPDSTAADTREGAATTWTGADATAGPAPGGTTADTPEGAAAPWPLPETPAGAVPGTAGSNRAPGPPDAGPVPDANLWDHDGAGPAGADSSREHTAGAASTEAADGQEREDPAPSTTGPAETGRMASGPPTSASGALSGAHANMAPAGLSNPSVSGETEGGGGVVNQRPENPSIEEDEAAIAVREAVSRAAAQAGVDVSRETAGDTLTGVPSPPGAVVEALGDTPRIDSATAARNARVTFKIHTDGVNGHGRILAVANQKGGVGKSTTAVNLGAYLALAGARVLVVDLDPQGNASTGLGLDHREIEPSIYDVLTGETPPATAIRATGVANLHVLPSTIDLAGAEVELVSAMSREGRLRRALDSIHHFYDTVLIDCPPSLGLLTVNALAAADELLIPIQCEYYALEGLGQLLRNVELVRANLNPELRIGGIVLTMYDGRTRLAEQVVAEVRKHFSDLVYQTVVPRSVRLSEAPGYGLPIALYDPLSRGGIAYRDLAFELAERSGLLAPTGEGAI